MNILILEKEHIVKIDIEHQLVKNGFTVSKGDSLSELDIIVVGQYSFLDEIMEMRPDLKPDVRFVFFTTETEKQPMLELTLLKNAVFISKPFDSEMIITLIKRERVN